MSSRRGDSARRQNSVRVRKWELSVQAKKGKVKAMNISSSSRTAAIDSFTAIEETVKKANRFLVFTILH